MLGRTYSLWSQHGLMGFPRLQPTHHLLRRSAPMFPNALNKNTSFQSAIAMGRRNYSIPNFPSFSNFNSKAISPIAISTLFNQKAWTTSLNGLLTPKRSFHSTSVTRARSKKPDDEIIGVEQEEENREDPFSRDSGPGYLPFPAPFHTINVIMILIIANVLSYLIMNFSNNDDWRDFIVEHFTLSRDNWTRIYPLVTNAFYQENALQLFIDCWLLLQFGDTILGFLGGARLAFFAALCIGGGDLIHLAVQHAYVHFGMDEVDVRGRCYGPNTFIMGLVSMEGLIFRHLNFIAEPPIPFLVLTVLVMTIDIWRIFTVKPEEHGAATGGALMAYVFWALPARMFGLDKLTAAF